MKKITFLFAFFLSLLGGTQAWAETADFENALPDGWEKYGSLAYHESPRCHSGSYGLGFSSSSTFATTNYLVTTKLQDNVTIWYRSYSASKDARLRIYVFKDGVIGTTALKDIETTSGTWNSVTYELSEPMQIAIVLNNMVIDDMTYTEYVAVTGPGFLVKDGSTKLTTSPYAYNFGLATAGTTKEFTLSNPGTAATPIKLSTTGNVGASIGEANSIAAGGEVTLTLTMPNANASGTVTITPTGDGLAPFVFNVSGTVRDPNKVYLDFSDGSMPDGWTSVAIGSSASSYGTPWTASTGYVGQSGTSSSYEWAFTSPKMVFSENETIIFETQKYNLSTWYNPSITVQYKTEDGEWTTVGSTYTDDTYDTWTKRSVTIPTADAKYIRFSGWYVKLRNIYGGQLPLNPTPKDLAYSNVGNTFALLSWTSTASKFNIQYKGTGDADWTTIENVTANPYTLTGLTAETTYQVKVQADHGVNGLSDYTEAVSFTTKPNPISTYPYTENFNSLTTEGQIPDYWDNSEGTTTENSYKWSYNSSYGTGHEGKCVRFDSYYNNTGRTNFLKTRSFVFTEGTPMKLSFWYKNPKGGDFSVYASTDGGTTYPTELATGLTGKSEWTQVEINIPAAVYGNNVVIVFKGTSNYSSGDARIYLDDVEISEISDYAMSISGSDVTANTIAFGTVKNTTTTKTFTISNDGGSALTGVTVVSSDDEVFTVSETGFDIAVGASKDITVTFVKAVEGDYSETITVSQTNVTPIDLTATATYQTPTPATMAITVDESAVGSTVAFGSVGKQITKTFTVTNDGDQTLNITSIVSDNTTDFTVSPATLTVAGHSSETFTVTFVYPSESPVLDTEKAATITLTPSNAGLDPVLFAVTGTRVNLWSEDFSGNALPTGWDAESYWTFADGVAHGAYNYSNNRTKALTTPNLIVTGNTDVLQFKAKSTSAYVTVMIKYSKDGGAFTELKSISLEDNMADFETYEITGLEAGNYRFQFMNDDYDLDDFDGFKLVPVAAHAAEVKTTTIPTTGNQYVEYTASVDVKVTGTNNEELTVKFFIGDYQYGSDVVKTVSANAIETFEVTFTPDADVSGDAYFTIESADITAFQSEKTAVTIAAATVLDETVGLPAGLETGTKASVVLKYTAKDGWNTIAVPFALTDEILTSIFGPGYKVFELKSFADNTIDFKAPEFFAAGYPYLVYVETAATHAKGVKLFGLNISTTNENYDTKNGVTFQTTYAGITAGAMTDDWYGVTSAGEIHKAGSGASLKGFRAYFTGAVAGARISVDGDGIVTGINSIDAMNNVEGVYNLNGQKVERLQKGLYIVNGKKVVKK